MRILSGSVSATSMSKRKRDSDPTGEPAAEPDGEPLPRSEDPSEGASSSNPPRAASSNPRVPRRVENPQPRTTCDLMPRRAKKYNDPTF